MLIYHFLSTNWALEAIRNQRLKVSKFDKLNDPFELYAVELTSSSRRREFRAWKREMTKQFGLMCFSKRWRSPLLWSHYADRHKGVAIEVEVPDKYIAKVNYHPERLLLDIDKKLAGKGLTEDDVYNLYDNKI